MENSSADPQSLSSRTATRPSNSAGGRRPKEPTGHEVCAPCARRLTPNSPEREASQAPLGGPRTHETVWSVHAMEGSSS